MFTSKRNRRAKMKTDRVKKKEYYELEQDRSERVVFKTAVKQVAKTFADVSVNDSANLSVSHNKLKKSKRIVNVVKPEEAEKEEIISFDLEEVDNYDYVKEEKKDGTVTRFKKQTRSQPEETDAISGVEYPTEIWFLISAYIRPEDVGRFAGICKRSYYVTSTVSFWYSLYKRHYRSNNILPSPLKPPNIFREYGIRTSVVRALFHMYPPFVAKLGSQKWPHPDVLCRSQCLLANQQCKRKDWFYYFKFKEGGSDGAPRDFVQVRKHIKANPEEGCRMLVIVSNNFYPVPPVERWFLASADVRLSSTMRERNVFLNFVSGLRYVKGKIAGSSRMVQLDEVSKICVLDWWDSRYPYVNNPQILSN